MIIIQEFIKNRNRKMCSYAILAFRYAKAVEALSTAINWHGAYAIWK